MAEPNEKCAILIFGGCGFVGYAITQSCAADPYFYPLHVASRKPDTNLVDGVGYHSVDICSPDDIRALIDELRPTCIINCSSPSATLASNHAFKRVTIEGTRNIINAAVESYSVRALIYTSSSTMAYGHEHIDLSEDARLADEDPLSHAYASTKAIADKMVLAANKPSTRASTVNGSYAGSLLTGCIRLPIVYGERDYQAIPPALKALEKGQTQFQVGDGANLWEFCEVGNAATAHILLAKALLSSSDRGPAGTSRSKVDGEAFHISDGNRQPFWEFPRQIWRSAGWDEKSNKKGGRIYVVPAWLALLVAAIAEWVYWIVTLGTKRPFHLGKQQMEYFCFEHTYDIRKARERLNFVPEKAFEAKLKGAVEWHLREEGWEARLRRKVKKAQ